MNERYLQKRQKVEEYFSSEHRLDETEKSHFSPCGKYQLVTYEYSKGAGAWVFSRGVVTRLSDGKRLADVKRNHRFFWFHFVTHQNGKDYFLCGEDYQGYSTFNLSEGTESIHFPVEAHEGNAFCWTGAQPSPDCQVLAVDGCYWACDTEVVFFDFSRPDSLPYRELLRVENVLQDFGWKDNDTFKLEREIYYRLSDGTSYEELSEAEQKLLDEDETLGAYRKEIIEILRPPLQAA